VHYNDSFEQKGINYTVKTKTNTSLLHRVNVVGAFDRIIMKITGKVIIINIIYLLSTVIHGAQIFAVVPMVGTSHWNVMDAVLQTLVSAGHNVTAVTSYAKKERIANYTQVRIFPGKAFSYYLFAMIQ
jgi:hypothetical protein